MGKAREAVEQVWDCLVWITLVALGYRGGLSLSGPWPWDE